MSRPLLQCRRLSLLRAGGGTVLDRIDADFEAGAATLVTGDTGAGKSTLLHLLGGMLRPSSGEVLADGRPVSRWAAVHRDIWRRQVGIVFQHLHLLPDLSVEENLLLPCIPSGLSWNRLTRRANALLTRFDLACARRAKLHLLSGGQRQRVAWARALMVKPLYLLMDEPSAFQDDAQTRCLLNLLAETAGRGACIVVCSHDVRLRKAEAIFQQTYGLAAGHLERLA